MPETTARKALLHYDLPAYTLELIAQTHNTVFSVATPTQNYTLRASHTHKPDEQVASEMALLQALTTHQFPYATPTPLQNREGNWVTRIGDKQVVMMTYLEGEFRAPNTLTPEEATQLGQMIGHLHQWDYDLPETFTRPRLDIGGLFGESGQYALGEALSLFTPEQISVMKAVVGRVSSVFRTLGVNDYQFGIVHGDLLLPNVIFGETLGILDFEYCGWGYYLYDLTPLLWQLKPEPNYEALKQALWKGYSHVRPKVGMYQQMLEPLIAGRQVASMRWVALNQRNPHISPNATRIIAQRTEELKGFLANGRLKRRAFMG